MLRFQLLSSALSYYASSLAAEGPIYNVNLLSFRGAEGPEREKSLGLLLEYWIALGAIIETKAEGQILLLGEVRRVCGDATAALHPWQAIAIVRYPSLRHYHRVIQEDAFLQIKHLRRASLQRSVLYATTMDDKSSLEQLLALNKASEVRMTIGMTKLERKDEHGAVALTGAALLVGEAGYVPWRYFSFSIDQNQSQRRDDETAARVVDGNTEVSCDTSGFRSAVEIYFVPVHARQVEQRLGRSMPQATSSYLSNL